MSQALNDWSLFLTFLFITVCVLLIIEYCAGVASDAPKDPIPPYHHYLKSRGLNIGAGTEYTYRRVIE
jgi:hypothetical protein